MTCGGLVAHADESFDVCSRAQTYRGRLLEKKSTHKSYISNQQLETDLSIGPSSNFEGAGVGFQTADPLPLQTPLLNLPTPGDLSGVQNLTSSTHVFLCKCILLT